MKTLQQFTRMRHRVAIQTWTTTGIDGRGQPIGSWADSASTAAHINPLSGRIAEFARQLFATATHEVVIRYRDDVTRANRLVNGSRTFVIGHVENVDERGRYLRMLCAEEE